MLAAETQESNGQVVAIRDELAQLKTRLLERLETGAQEIAQLKQSIASRVDETDAVIDPNSPLREVFRR